MRPGMSPLRNLAQAILDASWQFTPDAPPTVDDLARQLAAGGHLEFSRLTAQQSPSERKGNVLLLVDQFEELFRYERQSNIDERKFFVELLLTSAEQRDVNVYIVITIRSDWLGQCALFRGLPETINAGQFLVPRLTREQMRLAIVGPAQVGSDAIEDQLVLRLLQESELNSDQLPVLQHCLMGMWVRARTPHPGPLPEGEREKDSLSLALGGEGQGEGGGKILITTDDYDAVGGLANALSNHADEAYQELNDRQQQIAQCLFRRLSERSANQMDTRRPTRLDEIAAGAGVPIAEVQPVIEAFRPAERCFLTPEAPQPLRADTVIDISHESLIRQ